jgi:hypothetical protein
MYDIDLKNSFGYYFRCSRNQVSGFYHKRTTVRKILLIAVFALNMHAFNEYPKLYTQLGTPLFQATEQFEALKGDDQLSQLVTHYLNEAEHVMVQGRSADESGDKAVKSDYLKSLRSLQKVHDRIVELAGRQILDVIEKNDYAAFLALMNSGMTFDQHYFNRQIVAYYKQHREKQQSAIMEKLMNDTEAFEETNAVFEQATAAKPDHGEFKAISYYQQNLKRIWNESDTRYFLWVSCGGDQDWVSINGKSYSVAGNSPYMIGYAVGNFPTSRVYMLPMPDPFIVHGFISRPGRKAGVVVVQNNAANRQNYLGTASISDMHQYIRKIVYVTERADGGITVMGADRAQLDIDSSKPRYQQVLKSLKW